MRVYVAQTAHSVMCRALSDAVDALLRGHVLFFHRTSERCKVSDDAKMLSEIIDDIEILSRSNSKNIDFGSRGLFG